MDSTPDSDSSSHRFDSGHVADIFRMFFGHVSDMFGVCLGHVLDICWTCFGHVLDMFWRCFGHDWVMFETEDVILSCNIFWHVFFICFVFIWWQKANFGRTIVVLGEIFIYFLHSVANILISGWG